ncbi:MAG: type II toxin-antitoxin system RelE/ParE family toxin [Rhodanobacteraceae bacterium]
MTRIELAPEIDADFARILEHLEKYEAEHAVDRISEISAAIAVLKTSPLMGRPAPNNRRELIIGRGSHGYVARYRYVASVDTVFVLNIRAQRESGYATP